MKLLVVGSGGREHAIAKKLLESKDVEQVFVAPGNDGMTLDGLDLINIGISEHSKLIDFAKANDIAWTFIGPDDALAAGIVDDFNAAGLKAFGPTKAAAELEWSKDFAKEIMVKYDVPTAAYGTFSDFEEAKAYIEEKYLTGQIWNGSWKVEENQMIKKQNALLQKVITTFGKVSGALSIWKEWLNDIRRKQRSNSHDGSNDYTDRGTAEYHGRDASGNTGKGREADVLSGEGRTIAAIRERIIRTASNLAGYRRTVDTSGRKDRPDTEAYRRKSAMAGIGTEIKQREPAIAETEQRITELEQQLEKGRSIDERIKKLKERRSTGRVASADRADAGRTRPERQDYPGTENAARRIADLEREVKQREQSREHSSLKERLEENKRIIAEREKENAHRPSHDRGMSR